MFIIETRILGISPLLDKSIIQISFGQFNWPPPGKAERRWLAIDSRESAENSDRVRPSGFLIGQPSAIMMFHSREAVEWTADRTSFIELWVN